MINPYMPTLSPCTHGTYNPMYYGALIPQTVPYYDPNTGWRIQALQSPYTPEKEWHRSPQPPHVGGPERIEERHPHTAHINWAGLFPNEIILHGPHRKEVALTFDDGPDDEWTPRVLDVLRNFKVKATFFCIGQRIQKNPEVFRRIVSEGHSVGNHTWDHPNLTKIPISAVKNEIKRTDDEMFRLAGIRSSMFRPPYGALNADVIREVTQLKEKIIFWDVDSLDWAGLTAQQVSANILSNVRPGAIILQHSAGGKGESLQDTVNALPNVIHTLQREGYSFHTVPKLVNIPAKR